MVVKASNDLFGTNCVILNGRAPSGPADLGQRGPPEESGVSFEEFRARVGGLRVYWADRKARVGRRLPGGFGKGGGGGAGRKKRRSPLRACLNPGIVRTKGPRNHVGRLHLLGHPRDERWRRERLR